jgi:hypothetical protein
VLQYLVPVTLIGGYVASKLYDPRRPDRCELTRRSLASLPWWVQARAWAWLLAARARVPWGWLVHVSSGYRTAEEQAKLYEAGRSQRDGIKVRSAHQEGRAWDFYVVRPEGGTTWDHELYQVLGELAESMGLTWGGRWGFRDVYHLEVL